MVGIARYPTCHKTCRMVNEALAGTKFDQSPSKFDHGICVWRREAFEVSRKTSLGVQMPNACCMPNRPAVCIILCASQTIDLEQTLRSGQPEVTPISVRLGLKKL